MRDTGVDSSNEQTFPSGQKETESVGLQLPKSQNKEDTTIDHLLDPLTNLTLGTILCNFDVKPQNSEKRRKQQLRRLYAKTGSIQTAILEALQNASKDVIYNSREDLFTDCNAPNEMDHENESTNGAGPNGVIEPQTSRNNADFEHESDEDLLSPQYVPLFRDTTTPVSYTHLTLPTNLRV